MDDIARDVDPRARLAVWLRTGRMQRKLSLDDVARVTKIQPRILEKLETGCFEGLPADVFVRGFVRSVARCVGLDEREALERYGACAASSALPAAQAFVDTMRVRASAPAVSPVPVPVIERELEPIATRATGSSAEIAVPAVDAVEDVAAPITVEVAPVAPIDVEVVAPVAADAAPASGDAAPKKRRRKRKRAADSRGAIAIEVVDAWKPTMPPPPAAPSVPWQRPFVAPSAPTLVIDDADPESADQVRDARDAARAPNRVSFLPPILLDRDDASGRQGGLTLAVIILLIAATLTLSYLMRRPSLSGDGVTMRALVTHHVV